MLCTNILVSVLFVWFVFHFYVALLIFAKRPVSLPPVRVRVSACGEPVSGVS